MKIPSSRLRRRPLLLLALVLLTLGVLHATGFTANFSRRELQHFIESSGAYGVAGYFVLFAIAALLYIPPTIFIAAGILAYGALWGGVLSFVGSVLTMISSFVIVRAVGGQVLVEIEQPWVKRMLQQLDSRPIATIVVLRTVLWVSPPLTYVLAMSGIRFRDFALASALGLVVPLAIMAVAFDWLFE